MEKYDKLVEKLVAKLDRYDIMVKRTENLNLWR